MEGWGRSVADFAPLPGEADRARMSIIGSGQDP